MSQLGSKDESISVIITKPDIKPDIKPAIVESFMLQLSYLTMSQIGSEKNQGTPTQKAMARLAEGGASVMAPGTLVSNKFCCQHNLQFILNAQ